MKYGKSLLLGELINAEDVDYEDISKNHFWIVCPVCNEAIFKVVRQQDSSTGYALPIHYFSHYETSNAYASDCELRVSRITESEFKTIAVQSREQKLKYFISTLQSAIHQHFLKYAHCPTKRFGDGHFRQLRRSGTLAWYRNLDYRALQKVISKMTDEQILDDYDVITQERAYDDKPYFRSSAKPDKRFKNDLRYLSTTLGFTTQKRIALDLIRHLFTPQARASFDYLYDHAYTWLTIRLENNSHNALDVEKDLLLALNRLPNTSRQKGLLMLYNLGETTLDALESLLFREMVIILVSLTYLDILRQSLPKQHPQVAPLNSSCRLARSL